MRQTKQNLPQGVCRPALVVGSYGCFVIEWLKGFVNEHIIVSD